MADCDPQDEGHFTGLSLSISHGGICVIFLLSSDSRMAASSRDLPSRFSANMELKYGKDYHNYFDVENYLDFYRDPKLNEFQYVARHEFWSRLAPRKNLRVLNFGGGPVISDLISAAPFVKEIIFAGYSEGNRQAVEKWRQNLPDSHDWSAHFRFIL